MEGDKGSEIGKVPTTAEERRLANLTGGSRKGIPNKSTKRAREAFSLLLEANVDKLAGWLDKIEQENGTREAWRCLVEVADFAVPRLARTEIDATIRRPEEEMADEELANALDYIRMLAANGQSLPAKETT